jgi:ElaB/YqjD/DUF883 family membrane-anchored ribosome-binding protein
MRQTLEETLQQLHNQLSHADDLDQSQRDKLRQMVDEIRRTLDDADSDSMGLGTRLVHAASQFEHSHPTITNTIGRIADILAQMGI